MLRTYQRYTNFVRQYLVCSALSISVFHRSSVSSPAFSVSVNPFFSVLSFCVQLLSSFYYTVNVHLLVIYSNTNPGPNNVAINNGYLHSGALPCWEYTSPTYPIPSVSFSPGSVNSKPPVVKHNSPPPEPDVGAADHTVACNLEDT